MKSPFFEKITLLNQATLESFSDDDRAEIAKRFTEVGKSILEADFGFVWFLDNSGFHKIYKTPDTPYDPPRPREQGTNVIAQSQGKPLLIEEANSSQLVDKKSKQIMASLAIVPMLYRDTSYGNVIICYKHSHNFSEQDKALVTALGNSSAQAFTISQLYRQLKESKEALEEEVEKRTRELRETNRKLKELDKQREVLVSVASHELRTPVTSLRGFASLLKKHLEKQDSEDQVAERYLRQIEKQTNRLNSLIQDLLAVTKIRLGRMKLNKTMVDMNQLVVQTAEELQHSTKQHEIELRERSVSPILADQVRIAQVLSNYISNAIKYSPRADKIIVSLSETDSEIVVSVQDFGIGIPEKHLNSVFDLFYRSTTGPLVTVPGFGLGLYIAAEVIRAHNGRVWVESAAGQGSTFYFSLPIVETHNKNSA